MAQRPYSRAIASPSYAQSCAARFAPNLCRWPLLLLWLNLSGRHLRQRRRLTGPSYATRRLPSGTSAIAMMVSRANGGLCWTLMDGMRSRGVFEEVRVLRTLIHECQEKAREI